MTEKGVTILSVTIALLLVAVFATVAYAAASKHTLPRDSIYYEISNDAGDHGNFIETYHVPVPGTNSKVFCVVYSDQIGDGGGAGLSCDWQGYHKQR